MTTADLRVEGADLSALEQVWQGDLKDTYRLYRRAADHLAALAATLVERAVDLQQLGGEPARPPELLLGDLCLARASRLLAGSRDQGLQVGFARVVERTAASAAGGFKSPPVRQQLLELLATSR